MRPSRVLACVIELGQTRMFDRASALLADPRVGQLILGGTIEPLKATA
jgi:branched-chain amino acid transport system ATP-binding protein